MPLLLCVLKLCPEATNSVKTHLIKGTVPAHGKLVGFFPEVIVIRKDKTKRNVSFPHYRWQKEENTFLVRDVLNCLSGNNSYTDGMGCTDRKCLYCFSLVSFQCKKRCSSRDSLNA